MIGSHSSTTMATTLLPLAVIVMLFRHLLPLLYHPVDSATTCVSSEWNWPSHADGAPPSSLFSKPLRVRNAMVGLETGGEHLYVV
ncbi:hypothetical protein PVL29_019609 [Vitis rotundifolia]|uniref:Uncharacterized protein n=1 Tax=Vitis rotundifolia TaxID=103349 RepID=A0AA38Z0X9_VITRO|nr:hypothetical protein PVL29_019609 [Vitis rotundifolia]